MNDKHRLFFQDTDGSVITKAQLEDIIAASVVKANEKQCRFPISDEQAMETAHIMGMMSDLGDGDLSKGIEEARKNHSYVSKIRAKSDKFSTAVFMIIIVTITGGVLKACWVGIKSFITIK